MNRFTRQHLPTKRSFFRSLVLIILLVLMWIWACRAQTYVGPQEQWTDLIPYINKLSQHKNSVVDEKTEENSASVTDDLGLAPEDYDIIYRQTGLGRAGVQTIYDSHRFYRLKSAQNYFYGKPDISESRLDVVRHLERVDGVYDVENNNEIYPIFTVEDGDIIITLSSYIGGWRYGHTGLVVDADQGLVLEAMTYGEPSCIERLDHWDEYPAWAILRPRNLTKEERTAVARYAYNNLQGINYSLLASTRTGEVGKCTNSQQVIEAVANDALVNDENISRTQCAHIAWYAYHLAGLDLDSDWTDYVTPADILRDDDLELVMEYGFLQNIFEGRR